MAVDMLVDSTALDAALTATANAIRTKGGTSAPITWDDIKGFADTVDAIQTGGGSLPAGLNAVAYGTFTPAEQQSSGTLDITHNLGYSPVGVVVWYPPNGYGGNYSETNPFTTGNEMVLAMRILNPPNTTSGFTSDLPGVGIRASYTTVTFRVNSASGYLSLDNSIYRGITAVSSTTFTITATSGQCVIGTRTYRYIVWG